MNNTQNSSNIVKVTSIAIVAIIAAFAVWYLAVRDTQTTASNNENRQTAQTNDTEKVSSDLLGKECSLSDGSVGTQFTNNEALYSICLPNGWTLNGTGGATTGSAYLAFMQDMQYNAANKPIIKELGGTDSLAAFSLITNKPAAAVNENTTKLEKVGKLDAYYFEQTNASAEGLMGELPNGTKEYTYRIEYGGQSFEMSYRLLPDAPGATDQTKLVKAVAESFTDLF